MQHTSVRGKNRPLFSNGRILLEVRNFAKKRDFLSAKQTSKQLNKSSSLSFSSVFKARKFPVSICGYKVVYLGLCVHSVVTGLTDITEKKPVF